MHPITDKLNSQERGYLQKFQHTARHYEFIGRFPSFETQPSLFQRHLQPGKGLRISYQYRRLWAQIEPTAITRTNLCSLGSISHNASTIADPNLPLHLHRLGGIIQLYLGASAAEAKPQVSRHELLRRRGRGLTGNNQGQQRGQ
jgi:hypothetical protein